MFIDFLGDFMLDEKKIKESKINVKGYINERLLKKVDYKTSDIIWAFTIKSNESLKVANFLFEEGISDLWVVVTSYYSMYYVANAILVNIGYVVGDKISHKVTNDALIVFIRDKLKSNFLEDFEIVQDEAHQMMNISNSINYADDLIESFEFERRKRSSFQHDTDFEVLRSKSKTSLNSSKSFLERLRNCLIKLGYFSSIHKTHRLYF